MHQQESPKKRNPVFNILFILGLSVIAVILILPLFIIYLFFVPAKVASIGIIGGADGPTAIFLTSNFFDRIVSILGFVIVLSLSTFALWRYLHKNKK